MSRPASTEGTSRCAVDVAFGCRTDTPSVLVDIGLGILGAVVGGFLFNQFGSAGVSGLNVWSVIVATLGAVLVLAVARAFTGRHRLA